MLLSNTPTLLPTSFVPGEHTIIIGRGRAIKNHSGNRKFDQLIAAASKEYSAAPCKSDKGTVLTKVINHIYDDVTQPTGGFVKKDVASGQYVLVDEALARQTVAQSMRNYLHSQYRSSKKFKQQRRIERLQHEPDFESTTSDATACMMPGLVRCVSDDQLLSHRSRMAGGALPSDKETFDILMAAFANSEPTENPFDPTPLPSHELSDYNDMLAFEPIQL